MSDKIEDWIQRANDIATHIAELQARVAMYDTETLHNTWKKQKAALDTHLRTTPEGYRLVPVESLKALTLDYRKLTTSQYLQPPPWLTKIEALMDTCHKQTRVIA